MSLKPVAERLRMLLDKELSRGENVGFCPECVGQEAEEMAGKLERGQTPAAGKSALPRRRRSERRKVLQGNWPASGLLRE